MSVLSNLRDRLRGKPAPEIRRALDPETGAPVPTTAYTKQWAQGKMTFAGLLLTAIGAVGQMAGVETGSAEAQSLLTEIVRQWDDLATIVGLAVAFYGRLRLNWRAAALVALAAVSLPGCVAVENPNGTRRIVPGWNY
jgi:hypothetical protein